MFSCVFLHYFDRSNRSNRLEVDLDCGRGSRGGGTGPCYGDILVLPITQERCLSCKQPSSIVEVSSTRKARSVSKDTVFDLKKVSMPIRTMGSRLNRAAFDTCNVRIYSFKML